MSRLNVSSTMSSVKMATQVKPTNERQQALMRERDYRRAFRHDGSPGQEARAFEYFCKRFAKIQRGDQEIPFNLRETQEITVGHLSARQNIVILKARQVGFSTLFANYALWKVLTGDSYSVLFLSRNREEAVYLLSKAKFTYARLPMWLKKRLPKLNRSNEQRMMFANHSGITSLPSRKDAARGRTTSLLIADEFASLEDQEEAWAAMRPATDIGGQVVVLSTAKGSGDLFETLWNKATTKAMKFTPLFFSWRSAFDADWYEAKKAELLPWQLAQEHPNDPEEAFVKSGNAVFDLDKIKSMMPSDPMEGDLVIDEKGTKFKVRKGGLLRVWELPEDEAKYVIGVDIAEGLEHGDRSVAVVLRADTGECAAIFTCRIAPWEFAQEVVQVADWYNRALIGPERNNHGHAFIRSLVEQSYFPIFRHRRATSRREKETDELGWLTTPKTKAYMISQLDQFMEEHNINDVVTLAELRTYKRDERGKMSGSPFDDHVMAYAIAVEMLNHVFDSEYKPKAQREKRWSYGWYERNFSRDRPAKRIGER
jgi:hypothetical protein